MKRFSIMMFAVLVLIFSVNICWAEKAYVTNTSKITLRKGPGTNDKIINMLAQDTAVEVLETQSGWSRIRVLSGDYENQTGWIASGFLTTRVPGKVQAVSLQKENERLKKRLDTVERDCSASKSEMKMMREKLTKAEDMLKDTKSKYESLKKASGSFLELRDTHSETLKSLQEARVTLETLQKENLVLKSSQRNRWFLTGAVVLLVGLIFGLVLGRQQRKRRTSYY